MLQQATGHASVCGMQLGFVCRWQRGDPHECERFQSTYCMKTQLEYNFLLPIPEYKHESIQKVIPVAEHSNGMGRGG